MKKIILSLLVLIGISLGAFTQDKSPREIKGDQFFYVYAYDQAINKYARTNKLTIQGQRNLAISYRLMKQNDKSEQIYAEMVSSLSGLVAEDYYNYAMVLKARGKYVESDVQMIKFIELNPNDLRAKSFQENRGRFSEMIRHNEKYTIRPMSINTSAQDFGTSFYKDRIVYVSSNASPKMIKRLYNWNNEPFLNLYVADVKDGQLKKREFFDKKDNGKMHDGPASFSKDGNFMAYTKNVLEKKSDDKVIELRIYTRKFENNNWSEPVEFNHNNSAYSVGLPSLSADGKTMYFVSDMPNGFGGADLYRSTQNADESWTNPVNLGNTINTEGNEMFPFFDENKQILHFTSDGHYGLGGYDIFSSQQNGEYWGDVINAGAPLNSRYDDIAFIVNDKSTIGYFSSNRSGGEGSDDIYGVDISDIETKTIKIVGIAMDAYNNMLSGVTVRLFDENMHEISKVMTNDRGDFSISVEANKNYSLTGNREGFKEGKNSANTFDSEETQTIHLILLIDGESGEEIEHDDDRDIEEVELVDENIVVNEDIGAKIKMKPIYFDFDKSVITPKAAKELDRMIKVMNQFPKMEVELTAHTDCRGPAWYNINLSEARAKSSTEYIQRRITNPKRISGKGAGESKPVNNCVGEGDVVSTCSEQEHQLNRRTEFIVIKK